MRKCRINLLTIVIVIVSLFLFVGEAYGFSSNGINNQIYIVVANRLSLLDIDNMPNLKRLASQGALGLMNVRGLVSYAGAEGFATINSSNKTYASVESSEFHNLDRKYRNLYENRTNFSSTGYEIGNIQIGKLENQNEDNNYLPNIGALGDAIHKLGLKTAVFGNSDTNDAFIRTSSLIAMNSKGLVDYGNIDNILVEDNKYPYNLKTDYDKILLELDGLEDDTALIVIDTGDLNRLSSYSGFLSNKVFLEKREMILADIDNFIGNLENTINEKNGILMVVSPNRSETRVDKSRLTPIILWGNGINKGVLTSSTTNKKGIVTNLDIGPTVLKYLNTSNKNMAGSPLKIIESNNSFDYITNINGRINLTNTIRTRVLLAYGIFSIIVFCILILLLRFQFNLDNNLGKSLEILLTLIYMLPLILILISLLNINSLIKFITILLISHLIEVLIVWKLDREKIFKYITFTYTFLIFLDLVLANFFTRFSVLSHDPIIGARYFGIGNELTGVFLGVIIILCSIILDKYKKEYIIMLILLFTTILVGHPRLGANVGGTLSFAVTLFSLVLLINKEKLNWKNSIFIIGLVGIFIAMLGYIDIYINPNPTHLGKSLILLNEKGLTVVKNIINRKILMNIKLIGTSIWTKVLFVNILVQLLLVFSLRETMEKILNKNSNIVLIAGLLGSIFGLLLNDSGIILAALSINFITVFLLGVVLSSRLNKI